MLFFKPNILFNPKNLPLYAIKNINEAVICVNSDFEIKYINTSCEKLIKYSNKELLGKKLKQFFNNITTYNEIIQEINHLPENQSNINLNEVEIIDADNKKITVAISLKKITGGSKTVVGFILILNDISEIKNYDRALLEINNKLNQKNNDLNKLKKELEMVKDSIEEKAKKRADEFKNEHAILMASINDLSLCFLMTDKYNNIIFNNKAANDIFPFLSIEKKITVVDLQISSEMNLDLSLQIKKAINEKVCVKISDVQINSKFINIIISPIILGSKYNLDAIGTILIIKDQTIQHNLMRSKEDLFNIASHELRTPLTAIYGYAALIKQIYFGNIQNKELKMIINNIGILSKKLSLSVSNFLDSSKLEQGKIELNKDQCNLFLIINDSIKEMEDFALWKNLYIKFDPPASPVILTADQMRIKQILNILINNAIKFTVSGGIYISTETISNSNPIEPNFIKIIIKDTGIGISNENKKLLFQKFQRTGSNLLTRQEGTGLGLHIAKLLIEKMGGTIKLEKTEINKGSTFSFTIPIPNN